MNQIFKFVFLYGVLILSGLVITQPGYASTITLAQWTFGPVSTPGLPAFWVGNRSMAADEGTLANSGLATLTTLATGGAFNGTWSIDNINSTIPAVDDGTDALLAGSIPNARSAFVVVEVNTLGSSGISIAGDALRTGNGLSTWGVAVSLDQASWENIGVFGTGLNSWQNSLVDLSMATTATDNQSSLFIRLNAAGAGSGANGYLDNITVTAGSVVPVPAAVWLFGSGLIGLIGFAKRKKNP